MTRAQVPGICFHGIGTPQRELEPGEAEYWIDVDFFHALMDDLVTWPAVSISFDDSNLSDLEVGLPALQERGLSAIFFVLAGRLDSAGSLDVTQLRALTDAGMRIGSHGMHHVPWRRLSTADAITELVTARRVLAQAVGTAVDEAALPLGRYDRQLLRRLRRLGYSKVHTSDRRPADPRAWVQPRFSVRQGDSVDTIRAAVFGHRSLAHRSADATKGLVKRWR